MVGVTSTPTTLLRTTHLCERYGIEVVVCVDRVPHPIVIFLLNQEVVQRFVDRLRTGQV